MLRLFPICLLMVAGIVGCDAPSLDSVGWLHHGSDQASTKYSPIDQINAENFSDLEVAWIWESADKRLGGAYDTGQYRATPLMINGRIYMATSHGQVASLDAKTGKQFWIYDPRSYARGKPNMLPLQTRGIEYWSDGSAERIVIATLGKQLISIDITTGLPDPNFGDNGVVDLAGDLGGENFDLTYITHGAPPIVVRDTIIVGSKIFDYGMKNNSPPGHVRAYDVRTGALKWRFNTIPQEGEAFTETWENGSWKRAGNANVWTMMAADEELGYVYLPTSTPTNDYWGGMRHGDNLFAESLVCVDVETGERVWHFQSVHHGIWDYDIASAPNLVDIVVDGRAIKAVAQVSKTGFTYVFDRKTGEPVWPIVERAVPEINAPVPGEKLSPTQPHPVKPPPFERQGISEADLIDFTPELKSEALDIAEKFVLGPIFTPLIVKGDGGKQGTIVMPGAGGGANFPGASFDPETNILYVESQTAPTGMALVEPTPGFRSASWAPEESGQSDWRYVIEYQSIAGPRGLPLFKPPYRRITAIDLNRGEHVWQIPMGSGPKDHPEIKHLDLGDMGSSGRWQGGLLVTKTLLIGYLSRYADECRSGECGRQQGTYLRAFDKLTGELLAEVEVEQSLHGALMTYLHQGRQYIAAAAGGFDEKQVLIVFALPTAG